MKRILLLASIGLFFTGCMGDKTSNDPTISLESAVQCDDQIGKTCTPNCTNMQDGKYCLVTLSFNKGDNESPPLGSNVKYPPVEMGGDPSWRTISLYEKTIYNCDDTIKQSGRNSVNSCILKFQYFASNKPFTQTIQLDLSGIQARPFVVGGIPKQ